MDTAGEGEVWQPISARALAPAAELPPGEVHLWLYPNQGPTAGLGFSTRDYLPQWAHHLPEEKLRATQEAPTPQRQENNLAWLGTELLLTQYLDCGLQDLCLAERGSGRKPRLDAAAHPGQALQFNLSHSGGWSLLALTLDREIGADLERERVFREPLHFARRFLHPTEAEFMEALPPAEVGEGLRRIWVRKEAAAKATGFGLPLGLSSFAAVPDPANPTAWQELVLKKARTPELRPWCLRTIPAPEHFAAAICLEGTLAELGGTRVRFYEMR